MVSAASQAVHQGPAERGPMLNQKVDRLGYQSGADGIRYAEFQEPCLNFRVQPNVPHPSNISKPYAGFLGLRLADLRLLGDEAPSPKEENPDAF
ncbi:hypothetical protein Ate02nite_69100 [Paractinoplanes tereljensis]|uniref:Uncharacterized protein n=1 Tax=Paractinoplanes tereljensis TaxID=571912 RepID=A0A919NTW9_9ACTN|nr:hypothetical protein Ate02nite_69100 [Actinoplanes tereljensis]